MLRSYRVVPCNLGILDVAEMKINIIIMAVHVAVKWKYKDFKQRYSLRDSMMLLKVRHEPVGCLYKASVLLMNT